jgi:Excalibur calcium-binding domain
MTVESALKWIVGILVATAAAVGVILIVASHRRHDPIPVPARTSAPPSVVATNSPTVAPSPARTTIQPDPTVTERPTRQPSSGVLDLPNSPAPEVYYKNCAAVRAAGAAPIHRGDPGYASRLDRDGDGTGCEN